MNKILVIAAHPDDEILGVGGTLVKHVQSRDRVYCLILGEGMMSRSVVKKQDLDKLHKDSRASGKVIGFKEMYFSDFPDNSFDSIPLLTIVKEVEKYLKKIKPDIVYTHFSNDLNIDHRLTFQAVMTASRPVGDSYPSEIYTFETPSSTEWQSKDSNRFPPSVYVDIKKTLNKKVSALKKYRSEIRKYPHPRSIKGLIILAQYRGLESGLKYAEALCLIRKISS